MTKTDDFQEEAYGLQAPFRYSPKELFPVSLARGFGPTPSPAPAKRCVPDRKGFSLQSSSHPQGGDSGFDRKEDVPNGGSGKGGTYEARSVNH